MTGRSGFGRGADAAAPASGVALARDLLRRHRPLRFLLAGLVNTAVGYGLFLLALALVPGTTLALLVSTILAVLFNFVTTGSYVFGSTNPARIWRFFAVYGLVFLYNAFALAGLETLGIAPQIGGVLALPGAVAISYLANRSFVFGNAR